MSDNEEAIRTVELFLDNSLKSANRIFKEAAKEVFIRVVDQTPTFFEHEPSSGNTKANWNASVGSPDRSYAPTAADYSGDTTKSNIRGVIQRTKVDGNTTFYLSNSSPSLPSLELGLYPNPPFLGSWNTLTQTYEIRSRNGYSLQAPQGIVGVTALQWPEIVSDMIARYSK